MSVWLCPIWCDFRSAATTASRFRLRHLPERIFVVVADTVARTVIAPRELPVGAITALIGAPLFIYLLQTGIGRMLEAVTDYMKYGARPAVTGVSISVTSGEIVTVHWSKRRGQVDVAASLERRSEACTLGACCLTASQ